MRVAIVGANGLCGRSLGRLLQASGHHAIAIQRAPHHGEAAELRRCDVGELPPDALAERLADVDAVVNLVGIKRGDAAAFMRAHVEVPRRICAAAAIAGVTRVIHISVAGCREDPRSPYMRTKFASEAIIRGSGLRWTILRPGVIYGEGDDLLGNLAAMLLHAPIFPAPGGGRGELQPIAAEAVALAILRALEREASVGHTVDVVGPERLPLRSLVHRVAAALGLPVWIVPLPTAVMRPAAALMGRWLADPPITPSQLDLLAHGVIGDPAPARALLGIDAAPLDAATIQRVCAGARPWLGVSLRPLRIVDRPELAGFAAASGRAALFLPIALALPLGLSAALGDLWRAMPTSYAIALPTAILLWPRGLRSAAWARLRLTRRALHVGGIAAVILYALGAGVLAIAGALAPALARQLAEVYALAATAPGLWAIPLLALTIVGEEVVWRGAILLPLAAQVGPWIAVGIAAALYALAHALAGPPLLAAAALGAGVFWGWLSLRTGSLMTAIVCHLLWDLAVVIALPYPHPPG